MVKYLQAKIDDLPDVAGIFLSAFSESVRHYSGGPIGLEVIEDAFTICLDSEPEAFLVAQVDGKVAGYVFAPAHFSHLVRVALLRGHLWSMFGRWVTGRYGIGVRPAIVASRNWLQLLRESREAGAGCDARILSIAVDPEFQGCGIGSGLMERALRRLEALDAGCVRLEVRPQNQPAKHIYERLGFREVGRTRDTQGDWLVMQKDLGHA